MREDMSKWERCITYVLLQALTGTVSSLIITGSVQQID